MPVGSLAVLLAVAGLAFVDGWQRRSPEWRWLALIVLVGALVNVLIRRGIDTHSLFNRPPIFDVLAVLVLLVMTAHVVGPRLPIARRLGWSLHSAEWEFDGRLFRLNEQARAVVKDPQADAAGVRTDVSVIMQKIASLRPPDQDWALIRDGWVEAWRAYLAIVSGPPGGRSWDDALALQRDLIERTEHLRARYRGHISRVPDDRS